MSTEHGFEPSKDLDDSGAVLCRRCGEPHGPSEPPHCPVCAHAVESVRDEAGWWAIPCGHALGRRKSEELRAQLEAVRPLWRFDVPVVPAHVTALKGRYGNVWVLAADGYWNRWSTLQGQVVAGWRPFEAILEEAPLVECEDPRSTS